MDYYVLKEGNKNKFGSLLEVKPTGPLESRVSISDDFVAAEFLKSTKNRIHYAVVKYASMIRETSMKKTIAKVSLNLNGTLSGKLILLGNPKKVYLMHQTSEEAEKYKAGKRSHELQGAWV